MGKPEQYKQRHRYKINKWIKESCETLGQPELAKQISFGFNGRLSVCAGRAWGPYKSIELSCKCWDVSSEEERKNTVVHELCHIIDYQVNGPEAHANAKVSHGPNWQAMMESCGMKAERFHSLPVQRRRQTKYLYSCGCTMHAVSKTRHNRIQEGSKSYHCKLCGQTIKFLY
jgi:SprT protein